jgi:hypothetical protein
VTTVSEFAQTLSQSKIRIKRFLVLRILESSKKKAMVRQERAASQVAAALARRVRRGAEAALLVLLLVWVGAAGATSPASRERRSR